MRITNNYNLPEPFVNAACSFISKPRPGKLSVTELISTPQVRWLKIKHWEHIEEDAADRVWALVGSALHKILQDHAVQTNSIAEEYMKMEVLGYEIRGVLDLLSDDVMSLGEGGVIDDYKMCSWYAVKDGAKEEWVQQLNIYAAMLRETAGISVTKARIIPIIRDWSRADSLREPGYPEKMVMKPIEIPLWDHQETMQFIRERVYLHKAADLTGDYGSCSALDRWEKPDRWRVLKKGGKRALRSLETQEGAKQWVDDYVAKDPKKRAGVTSIVHQKGESTRCAGYCNVAKFCLQWAKDPLNPKNRNGGVNWEST